MAPQPPGEPGQEVTVLLWGQTLSPQECPQPGLDRAGTSLKLFPTPNHSMISRVALSWGGDSNFPSAEWGQPCLSFPVGKTWEHPWWNWG